jgi:hypothetical protein
MKDRKTDGKEGRKKRKMEEEERKYYERRKECGKEK